MFKTRKDELNQSLLKEAIYKTADKRDSLEEINDWKDIIADIKNEEYLENLWKNYLEDNTYIINIRFIDVVEALEEIAKWINE